MKIATALLLASVLAAGAVSYSWTVTPHGCLDYGAAVFSRLLSWQRGEEAIAYNDAQRRGIGRFTKKYMDALGFEPAYRTRDIRVPAAWGDIPVRVYMPRGEGPFPALLHYHGGGFWAGGGYVHDGPVRHLSQQASVAVFSVDYRLAPEHPFPAALEDCYRALQYVMEHARELNVDPARLGVIGGSAGGNLSAAVALMARDQGGPALSVQILEIPLVDISGHKQWASYDEMGDDYFLRVSDLDAMFERYAPDRHQRLGAYASPLLAEDHGGLPPAMVVVAQFDPLRDQGVAYAGALAKDGVSVILDVVEGAIHGFAGSAGKHRALLDREARFLREIFHDQPH